MRQFKIRGENITVTVSPRLTQVSHKPDSSVWLTLYGNGYDMTVSLNTLDINDLVRALIHESERRE